MAKEIPTPELDKMLKNKDESQAIGAFLDWLQTEKKVIFCHRVPEIIEYLDEKFEKECEKLGFSSPEERAHRYNNPEKWEHTGGLVNFNLNIENILAEFFGVDLKKAEKEKCAILDNLRKK